MQPNKAALVYNPCLSQYNACSVVLCREGLNSIHSVLWPAIHDGVCCVSGSACMQKTGLPSLKVCKHYFQCSEMYMKIHVYDVHLCKCNCKYRVFSNKNKQCASIIESVLYNVPVNVSIVHYMIFFSKPYKQCL